MKEYEVWEELFPHQVVKIKSRYGPDEVAEDFASSRHKDVSDNTRWETGNVVCVRDGERVWKFEIEVEYEVTVTAVPLDDDFETEKDIPLDEG